MGINVSKVSFAYYVHRGKRKPIHFTLNNINININSKCEFIGIVGHTGSGKSTLVQLLNALLLPTIGEIDAFGSKINRKPKCSLKQIRQHCGLVFQFPEYQIFEETVLKDVMFGPKNFLGDNEKAKNKAIEALNVMNISDLSEESPFALSGGQMRKVAIAGILASNPDVLILDEPTVGLDPLAKKELLVFLKKLNEEYEKTIIIITHDMDVIGEYIKRVIVLKEGNVIFDDSKDKLFRNEQVIKEGSLDYPVIIKMMKDLKDKIGIDFDIYQYNLNDAFNEIKLKMGEDDE